MKNFTKIKNNENQLKTSAPFIYTPGLNQLYFIDYKFLTYPSLEKEIISIIQIKNKSINFSEELSKVLLNYYNNSILNFSEFKRQLFEKTNLDSNKLLEYLKEWISDNVSYLHKKQLTL